MGSSWTNEVFPVWIGSPEAELKGHGIDSPAVTRLSRYFLPTVKEAPADAEAVSHRLTVRAGLARQVAAGLWSFLPAGWRAHRKVEQIIREELDAIGCGEMLMPVLVPAELWRLARGADTNIAETAAALTESIWHRNCLAVQKQRFIDQFLTFIEHTNRAASVSDVFDALLEHVPALLGVYAALLLVPAAGPHAAQLLAISDSRLPLRAEPLHIPAVRPFGTPAPITDAEIAPGGAFAALAPLLHEVGARCMNSVPIGEHCLILLVERRAGREFSGEDWFRMHVIARHADRALERFSYVSRNLDVRDDPC